MSEVTPPNGNGMRLVTDQIKLVLTVVALTATIAGGLVTFAFKMLAQPSEQVTAINVKMDRLNDQLTTLLAQQAVINYKIDNHMADTNQHNGNH